MKYTRGEKVEGKKKSSGSSRSRLLEKEMLESGAGVFELKVT